MVNSRRGRWRERNRNVSGVLSKEMYVTLAMNTYSMIAMLVAFLIRGNIGS